MKKTRVFIGLAALVAVVSMNMRHAWMNYGIAENKIMAGVFADDVPSTKEDSISDTTPDTIVYHYNKTIIPIKCVVLCPVVKVTNFYKKVNGVEELIARGEKDLRTGKLTIIPEGADVIGAYTREAGTREGEIESYGQDCGKYQAGTICEKKSAIVDCGKLLSATS